MAATKAPWPLQKLTGLCKSSLAAAKSSLTATKSSLAAAKSPLAAAKSSLAAAKSPLVTAKSPLTVAERSLTATKSSFAAANSPLAAAKSSLETNVPNKFQFIAKAYQSPISQWGRVVHLKHPQTSLEIGLSNYKELLNKSL